MALQDELNGLRRLMDSINRQGASNAQSVGRLTTEVTALQQKLASAREAADRAIQMCNDLTARLAALERK